MRERLFWDVEVALEATSRALPFVGRIAHDRLGAPYVVDAAGDEDARTLVSLSDEGDVRACAWTTVAPGSPVVGLGVDLVDADDFRNPERGAFLTKALFGENEVRVAQGVHPEDACLGYAYAFGAKEAAFKATSQPLRAWCRANDADMFFEVRDFALASDAAHAVGIRRAADVYARLGIGRIELEHVVRDNLVIVVAVAVADVPQGF